MTQETASSGQYQTAIQRPWAAAADQSAEAEPKLTNSLVEEGIKILQRLGGQQPAA
jgi:hypothetical protein